MAFSISIGSGDGTQSAHARRGSSVTSRLALALAATSFFAQSCNAQAPDAPDTGATIEATALALGTIRGIGRRMDSINTIQFTVEGTASLPTAEGEWTSYEINEATVGISYSIPARRLDVTRTGPDGEERVIGVVRGDRAWNERLPGVDPTDAPAEAVATRTHQIWLTPHGVITAAVQNPDAVTTGMRGGQTTLTVDIDGTLVTAVLDENSRPATVEMMIDHPVLGETLLEAEYTDYIDWPILDVYFPSGIVHRLGGETTLDLTVTEFFQNPYVVFPTPEQLSRSSQ